MLETVGTNNRRRRYRYGLVALVALVIAVPRLALLLNAPDVERIADTYIHEVLALGQAFTEDRALEFIPSVHKYPLLGPYVATPVVGAYYLAGRLSGALQTPGDLADAYLLGETALPLLFRVESLLFNLVALFFIFKTAQEFSQNRMHAGWHVLLAAGVSFYVTVFSVSPRIHNLVFLFSALTLFLSLRYYRSPSRATLFTAFSGAGLAFAAAQSGLPALAMPLAALVLAHTGASAASSKQAGALLRQALGGLRNGVLIRQCALGLSVCAAIALVVGYPGALLSLVRGDMAGVAQVFLSSEHSDPSMSIGGVFTLLNNWVRALELVWLWPLVAAGALVLARKRPFILEGADIVAGAHVLAFLVLFGFSSVTVGRFSLAVLPSLFFLGARAAENLARRTWFLVPLVIFFILQLSATGALVRAAVGGDTRQQTASFLIAETMPEDRIVSNIPRHLLGIVATPESLRRQQENLGRTDTYVLEKDLRTTQSRDFYYWNPTVASSDSIDWKSFSFVVVREPVHELPSLLSKEGFVLAAEFVPYSAHLSPAPEDFNWDFFGTGSALALFRLSRFGPAISIFKNIVQ